MHLTRVCVSLSQFEPAEWRSTAEAWPAFSATCNVRTISPVLLRTRRLADFPSIVTVEIWCAGRLAPERRRGVHGPACCGLTAELVAKPLAALRALRQRPDIGPAVEKAAGRGRASQRGLGGLGAKPRQPGSIRADAGRRRAPRSGSMTAATAGDGPRRRGSEPPSQDAEAVLGGGDSAESTIRLVRLCRSSTPVDLHLRSIAQSCHREHEPPQHWYIRVSPANSNSLLRVLRVERGSRRRIGHDRPRCNVASVLRRKFDAKP